ncbi:DNA mismatch repair endonuclease MutL [Pollutibacter soli]|uniref:DNA mismatch repair endonuclease MutL n=1 Tax=Pollutibacter soli TaxID=3034157 RepID=UPI00301378E1
MPDLIHLLPDNIANQIAAGEVIQRPASAVKELLENAVDAGATRIRMIVQDAGKSLIQVIDNGKGMSETDARMCFERHATSKISGIDDLFKIRTMGFRGEALASIAAVAQVELKTKRAEDTLGTYIEIENSVVKIQEPCSWSDGTSFSMKNLFFNIPARRNFLKTNAAEMRHIVDEFVRVALAFPDIFFSLTSNNEEIFHLEKGTLKQRIQQILGNNYISKLVSVTENTDYLNISGFVGKPDTAKKTRGDQFIFVNNRFIRSAYLNHAVMNAYQDMIATGSFPMFVLFIDLDPSQVDINVHPTKQEIKFEDEKIVYAFVHAAVKHALAQFSVAPSLDFDLDPAIQQLDAVSKPITEAKLNETSAGNLFRTFTQKYQAHKVEPASNMQDWKQFFSKPETSYQPSLGGVETNNYSARQQPDENESALFPKNRKPGLPVPDATQVMQVLNSYILFRVPSGLIIVDQQAAHERILFERFTGFSNSSAITTQKLLFPITIEFSPGDAAVFSEILPDLTNLGYHIEPFGKMVFIMHGTPSDLPSGEESGVIEHILEEYKNFNPDIRCGKREKLYRSMAYARSIKSGTILTSGEMVEMIRMLSECNFPNTSLNGQQIYVDYTQDFFDRIFGRR